MFGFIQHLPSGRFTRSVGLRDGQMSDKPKQNRSLTGKSNGRQDDDHCRHEHGGQRPLA